MRKGGQGEGERARGCHVMVAGMAVSERHLLPGCPRNNIIRFNDFGRFVKLCLAKINRMTELRKYMRPDDVRN